MFGTPFPSYLSKGYVQKVEWKVMNWSRNLRLFFSFIIIFFVINEE